eukprot:443853-Amphidinium_carterae.1
MSKEVLAGQLCATFLDFLGHLCSDLWSSGVQVSLDRIRGKIYCILGPLTSININCTDKMSRALRFFMFHPRKYFKAKKGTGCHSDSSLVF